MSQSHLDVLARIVADNPEIEADNFTRALSAVAVRNAKPKAAAYALADGGGLSLQVTPAGGKAWQYRYRVNGKAAVFTVGKFPAVELADARMAHRAARWLVGRGIHPLEYVNAEIARTAAEEAAKATSTFRAVAGRWMDQTAAALSPRTVVHRQAMLERHVFPKIGVRPVADLRRKELADILKQLDQTMPEVCKQCRTYVRQALDWAVSEELLAGNPTPAAKDVQLRRKGERAPKQRIALPVNRIGEFLKTLEDAPDSAFLTKAAMTLLMLTWCRTSEVVAAEWSEFDLDAGLWVIPARRMKAQEIHTVYLSKQAVALLRELKVQTGNGRYLFPNRDRASDPMHRMTLSNWRKRWGFAGEMQVHGVRATASTWSNEAGRYRSDVIEAALAHRESDRVRAAYNRAQFVDELRQMWQDWGDLLDEKLTAARAGNVVEVSFKGQAA